MIHTVEHDFGKCELWRSASVMSEIGEVALHSSTVVRSTITDGEGELIIGRPWM